MRFRQLKSFIVVCELGSISKAAEQLFVAQPALGLQIRGLEDEVGAKLFERHPRGVQLTPAGMIVLSWAQRTMEAMQEVKDQVRVLSTGLSGTLTLGLTPTIASAFALPILAAVQKELPDVRIHLTEATGHMLKEWVDTGRIDCALIFEASGGLHNDFPPLLSEQLYFATTPATANAPGGRSVTLEQLLEFPLALPGTHDSIRKTVEEAARSAGLTVRLEYEVQSVGVLISLVSAGYASSVLPMPVMARSIEEGKVSALRIAAPGLQRDLRWWLGAGAERRLITRETQRVVEQALRIGSAASPWHDAYSFFEDPC